MESSTNSNYVSAELSLDGERVLVRYMVGDKVGYNPQFVKAIKKLASARFVGKEKPEGPAWRLDLDLITMRRLRDAFGSQLVLGERLRTWGHAEVAKEKKLTNLSQADDATLSDKMKRLVRGAKTSTLINGKPKRLKLRKYQKADIAFMASTNVICANQPRTGKTLTTISALVEADLEWGQHVVFAPVASLASVWAAGITETYEALGLDEPTVLTGDTPDQRREAIAEAAELAEGGYAFWLVLNPAMARMERTMLDEKTGEEWTIAEFKAARKAKKMTTSQMEACVQSERIMYSALAEIEWDSITIDEFHLMGLSNPTTLGAKGVNYIAEVTQPSRKFALSGTPMGGKPIKLWGALHFLDPDKFSSRWTWAKHWLVINTNGYGSKIEGIMPGREVDFYEHLKPYLVRRTKREALPGLPPMNRVSVKCTMTPQQREQYVQFATEAEWRMADAEQDERLTATNILAEYTRLKQFANAYCHVQKTGKEVDGIPQLEVVPQPDSGKLESLVENLKECNVIGTDKETDEDLKCALVFTQFNAMGDMVAAELTRLGVPTERLHAGKKSHNDKVVAAFQEQSEGAPRVLVMNTLMGTALTLDRAETVHMLDETWVPDNQEQAESRAEPTTPETMKRADTGVYYYRTSGTIEDYVQKLVADKALNNRTILDLRRKMQAELEKLAAASD